MTDSGLVVVDKPPGITSHDVVARVRRAAGTKKVGHAGTLDPMATGVLVLGVNKATRLLGHLVLAEKEYDATVRLGAATDTDDAEGEVVAETPASKLGDDEIRTALVRFVGDIEQVPSTVSAIKVNGQRAYRLAREGKPVELAARTVTISRVDLSGIRREGDFVDIDIAVTCSSGTYIRAIARDLGTALGVGGHLTSLRRTRVGPFALADTVPVPDRDEPARVELLPLADVGRRLFVNLSVDEPTAAAISFGRKLELTLPAGKGPVAMFGPAGELLALYEQQGDVAVPVAVLV